VESLHEIFSIQGSSGEGLSNCSYAWRIKEGISL